MTTATIQALAFGLPVVATKHSGFSDQVEEGINGFLVPEANPEALAERLAYLINHPELWEPFGRAGRKKAEVQYDSKALMDTQVLLYQEVIGEEPRSDNRTRNF